MSNKSAEIYEKHWGKMVKLVQTISDGLKIYLGSADSKDIPTHENLLMALQVFVQICGEKWQYDAKKLDELWVMSKDIHRLVKLAKDTQEKGQIQEPSSIKRGQLKN